MAGLRLRFLASGVLLVATTVAAASWVAFRLAVLADAADAAVREIDATASEHAAVASALEREDDALLAVLGTEDGRAEGLAAARAITDAALAALLRSNPDSSTAVGGAIAEYRRRVDGLAADPGPASLDRYQREANPGLRAALYQVFAGRDERLEETRSVARQFRDEVTAARTAVATVAIAALVVAAFVALRLARHVLVPMRGLARAAAALRDGDFSARVEDRTGDEIGAVAVAFNELASRLDAFQRSNLGEVLRAKATLELTMRALPDAVLLLDAQGNVASANPAAHRLFTELGLPLPATATGLGALLGGAPLEAPTAGATAPGLARARRLLAPGGARHLLPRQLPLDVGDATAGAVVVLSDVTPMVELDERRSELVAVASHELRTPLTTLRMSLHMLREASNELPPRARELVATAMVGIDLLGETVDELLDMARIEAGQLRLATDRVDLAALARETVARHRDRCQELGLTLQEAIADVAFVVGDRARLRSVLDNLLDNAAKYTPRGGSIVVQLATTGGDAEPPRVSIEVRDTGPGVPAALRERVFEKFFRVENLQAGSGNGARGAGIGLFLCRQIVALHSGTIECTAPDTGSGAWFRVSLPAGGRAGARSEG